MDKANRETMIALVDDWKGSGMSLRKYAQKQGLSKSKFEYWIRKVKFTNGPKNQYPQFIEVGTLAEKLKLANDDEPQKSTFQNPQIVLTFPSGLCLKIYR